MFCLLSRILPIPPTRTAQLAVPFLNLSLDSVPDTEYSNCKRFSMDIEDKYRAVARAFIALGGVSDPVLREAWIIVPHRVRAELSADLLASLLGSMLQGAVHLARVVLGAQSWGGAARPPKLTPCPVCGEVFGVRAMREHVKVHEGDKRGKRGRPPTPRPCPVCGKELGFREMAEHIKAHRINLHGPFVQN